MNKKKSTHRSSSKTKQSTKMARAPHGSGSHAKTSTANRTQHGRDTSSHRRTAKVGSDAKAAAKFAENQDFGIPADEASSRPDVAEEAKTQPAGDHTRDLAPISSDLEDSRTSGVGGHDSGEGSSSGGDLDTDVVGIGTGRGLSIAGPDDRTQGPDITTDPRDIGDRPPDSPYVQPARGSKTAGKTKMRGSTVNRSGGDASTTAEGMGSGSVTPAFDTGDDASAGEISQGEAGGDDN